MPAREEVLWGGSKKRGEGKATPCRVNARHRAVTRVLEQEATAWSMEKAGGVRQRAILSML